MTLKMAVLAPMPSAMVSAAASVKTGLRRRVRTAKEKSRKAMIKLIQVLAAIRCLVSYSWRSVRIGSRRAAREAGTKAAARHATTMMSRLTA